MMIDILSLSLKLGSQISLYAYVRTSCKLNKFQKNLAHLIYVFNLCIILLNFLYFKFFYKIKNCKIIILNKYIPLILVYT